MTTLLAEVLEALVWWGVLTLPVGACVWMWARSTRRASAAQRHLLWSGVLLAFVVIPLADLARPLAPGWQPLGDVPIPRLDFTATRPIPAEEVTVAVEGSRPVVHARSWGAVLGWTWGLGSAVLWLRLARGWFVLRRLRQRAGASPAIDLPETGYPVALSSDVSVPVAFGVLSPQILLPCTAITWSGQRLGAALDHEAAHLQRRDPAWSLFAALVCAVYWFHPLAWFARVRMVAASEAAADDLATVDRSATDYASDLVAIARAARSLPGPAVSAMALGPGIETRLRELLDPVRSHAAPSRAGRLGFRVGAWAFAAVLGAGVVEQGVARRSPVLGHPAVSLESCDALRGSFDRSVAAYRDRLTVLQFFSTRCGFDWQGFHELVEASEACAELAGLRFVLMASGADDAELTRFLERKATHLPVLRVTMDVARSFDAMVVPHTALVGPSGHIVAATLPEGLSVERLLQVHRGGASELPVKTSVVADYDWSADRVGGRGDAVWIEPSDADSGGSRWIPGSGRLDGDGVCVNSLLQMAYQVPSNRVDPAPLAGDDRVYKVTVVSGAKDDAQVRPLLRRGLRERLGWEGVFEPRSMKVLHLRRLPDVPALAESTATDRGGAFYAAGMERRGATMAEIARWFGNICGRPVIDETGMTARYDVDVRWVLGDRESFLAAVKSCGLELVAGEAVQSVLVPRRVP